ncbi:alpha/beta fold hydrolase [Vibrio sp. MEBiC08052]|uniref:alpha/beta fold hydrolase n=1 Tax=Vibrio sp. MEBiC08052 TaxID=1761910 RepID=UPI000740787F|nr:alpha/beta hydrolase [Vibrio sp. MEBiC08052]KUI99706.1 putative hydrolase/acyltransferase [Vibrio sp. MEBiC08052]
MLVQHTYSIAERNIAVIETRNHHTATCSVVFLHGWLDNAASFMSVMDVAAHQIAPWIHLCAIDLPGHGLSSHKSADNFYTFHDYIDDVHQFLVTLPAKKKILVGHSLGGLIASCYSAAFPEYVDGLFLIESLGPLTESAEHSVQRLRDGVNSRTRIRRKSRSKGYDHYDAALKVRAAHSVLPEALIEPIVARGIELRDGQWMWRADPKLSAQSLYRMSEAHADAVLAAIQSPFHVVLGDQGYPSLKSYSRTLLPEQIEIQHVKGGHHCHLEHPERVGQLISQFVMKIDETPFS